MSVCLSNMCFLCFLCFILLLCVCVQQCARRSPKIVMEPNYKIQPTFGVMKMNTNLVHAFYFSLLIRSVCLSLAHTLHICVLLAKLHIAALVALIRLDFDVALVGGRRAAAGAAAVDFNRDGNIFAGRRDQFCGGGDGFW